MDHKELGNFGEQQAKKYLEEAGYTILCSNYRKWQAELDIVAQIDNTLVVIEVKARATDEHGEPWMAVTRKKQKQIIRAANFYIEEFNIDFETRFDIISIIYKDNKIKVEHIVDAFSA